ncbi:MAG: hypothetical protein ACM31D_01360 [Bacteroidota bacterium]
MAFALAAAFLLPITPANADDVHRLVGMQGFDAVKAPELKGKFDRTTLSRLKKLINVSMPATLVDNRYVVFDGCVPHQCTVAEAFVALDTKTSAAAAWMTEDGQAGLSRTVSPQWADAEMPAALSTLVDTWRSHLIKNH